MLNIPDYQIAGQIGESAGGPIYQAFGIKEDRPVILKILIDESLSPVNTSRFLHGYDLARQLKDVVGVVKPYSLANIRICW